ncbi:MAG: hypothetical protein Q9172_002645 [Xanthocarpia lactea]
MAQTAISQDLVALGKEVLSAFRRASQAFTRARDDSETSSASETACKAELQRFQLWVINLGLFQSSHNSLDYRLRQNETARSLIAALLTDLCLALEDLVDNLSRDSVHDVKDFDGEVHPAIDANIDPQSSQSGDRSESSDSCSENADEIDLMNLYMDDVIEINDELIKIAMQIRSPYSRKPYYKLHPHGEGKHDDQDVYAKVLESFRKKGIEQVLLSARRRMLSIDQAEKSLVLRDCDEFLAHRLSKANDSRRQQFEYWRKYRRHSVRAATNTTVAADTGDSDKKLQPRALLVPTADVAQVKSDQKTSETMSMPISLLAPNFELRSLRSARTYQSRALTVHAPGGDIIAWPEVPSSVPIGEPDTLYESRDQWIQHEQWSHMSLWRCPKDDTEFEDFPAYKIHVDTQHPAAAEKNQLLSDGVLATIRSFAKQPSRSCPFCDVGLDSVGKMHDHIGGHLEAVALLAIPPLDDPDMQSQSDAASSVAAGKDVDGSRKNDFDKTLPLTFPENNSSNEYYSAPSAISGADFARHLARLPEDAVDPFVWITKVIPSKAPGFKFPGNIPGLTRLEDLVTKSTRGSSSKITASPGFHPQSIPSDISCLVLYEPLSPNYQEQPIRIGTEGNKFWAPPNRKNAYHRNRAGARLFRWMGGRMTDITPIDLHKNYPLYGVATIFTQYKDTKHLLAVTFDAEQQDVRKEYGGWKVLSFDHILQAGTQRTYYSSIGVAGAEPQLAAPGSPVWISQLLPKIYDYDSGKNPPQRISGGLIGNLPLLFALPAFSTQPDRLSYVLTTSMFPHRWYRHDFPHGHNEERGMVVTVFLDPSNKKGSTKALLDKLQDGYFGPFYGPW